MKLLCMDTSTSVMTIALAEKGKVLGELTTLLKSNHSVRLMPALSHVMEEVGWKPADLDQIAVGVGPGSYTGVRIGVTTAKSLAWALHIPLVGVSSLQTIALGAGMWSGLVSPFLDARRGQVYTGLYRLDEGRMEGEPVERDQIVLFADWKEKLNREYSGESVAYIGEEKLRASSMVRLVEALGLQGDVERAYDMVPNYTQLAEAEAKWLAARK